MWTLINQETEWRGNNPRVSENSPFSTQIASKIQTLRQFFWLILDQSAEAKTRQGEEAGNKINSQPHMKVSIFFRLRRIYYYYLFSVFTATMVSVRADLKLLALMRGRYLGGWLQWRWNGGVNRQPKMLFHWRMLQRWHQWWILVGSWPRCSHDKISLMAKRRSKTRWWWAEVAAAEGCKCEITVRSVEFFIVIFIDWSRSCHLARSKPSGNS